VLAFVTGLSAVPAGAQEYPARPIRFILPYAAGGSYDAIARMAAQKLTESWNQQVVIDNRPGAAGRIGMELAVKATPDGYSIVMLGNNQTIVPSVYKQVPYDLARDLAPVGMLATLTNVLVIHNSVPANSVAELISLAKAKPGAINFGSGGTGGVTHLAGELFKYMTQVNIVHVPYKGGAPAMNDLVGGQVQMMLLNMLNSLPHVRAGRLKGLAVTSLQRSRYAPDLPTLDESGLRGYEIVEWYGVAAPVSTPKSIVAKLHDAFGKVVSSADIRERLDKQAVEVALGSSQEFGAFVKADVAKYAQIVRDAGIRPE
jgi:tripartite-type tricarboxylate transporter receptor subunit TctC